MNKPWGIKDVWQAGFLDKAERPIEPRDRIWASELGKPPIEVYLKMIGTKPSNFPNDRARMKMEAGNIVEGVVKFILRRAGVLQDAQVDCRHKLDGMPVVSGKLDLLAGGKSDIESAKPYLTLLGDISEGLRRAGEKTIEYLSERYPDGLPTQPFEIKSVATYGMDSMELSERPLKAHRLQLAHYLISLDYPVGQLSYICRDDYRMIEFAVENNEELRREYAEEVQKIGKYYMAKELPPKAPLIMFELESGKFTKNLGVEWSAFLTSIYGFEEPREYGEIYAKKATSWNGVLKRIRDEAKITPNNEEKIAAMKEAGFDPTELAKLYKPGLTEDENE